MLTDIVVDANVFVHEHNKKVSFHRGAKAFVNALLNSGTILCVDEGFDTEEAKNRSHIGHEYLKHLKIGMLGFVVVATLASSMRVRMVPRKVSAGALKKIRGCVPNNSLD